MVFYFFLKGIAIGFSIAAIVGPIGVLCIRRSIAQGFSAGISTGLGAALADATYGAIGAFGLTIVTNFLLGKVLFLSLVGGLYLIYLGYTTFLKRPDFASAQLSKNSFITMFVSTFFLTMTNPTTILPFMALFAGFNLNAGSFFLSSILVWGIFIGSMFWWILLSSLGSMAKSKIKSANIFVWINRFSGIIIFIFGAVIIIRGLLKFIKIKFL